MEIFEIIQTPKRKYAASEKISSYTGTLFGVTPNLAVFVVVIIEKMTESVNISRHFMDFSPYIHLYFLFLLHIVAFNKAIK